MNNKKQVAIAATVGCILFMLPSNEYDTPAVADYKPLTQILSIPDFSLMDKIELRAGFSRGPFKIVETKPWLNKENIKKKLSEDEIRSILVKTGFKDNGLKMAMAIAFAESTFRPYALNRSSNCYGLFQINMTGSMGETRREKYGLSKNEDLYNPIINSSIAYQMSNGGTDWSAWSTEKLAKRSSSNY